VYVAKVLAAPSGALGGWRAEVKGDAVGEIGEGEVRDGDLGAGEVGGHLGGEAEVSRTWWWIRNVSPGGHGEFGDWAVEDNVPVAEEGVGSQEARSQFQGWSKDLLGVLQNPLPEHWMYSSR